MNAFDTLDRQVAKEGLIPTRSRKPRHQCGDAHVDPDHARVKIEAPLPYRHEFPIAIESSWG